MERLRDYPTDHIKFRCMDVINNQYRIVSQQANEKKWPVSISVPDLTELFPHLTLDEDYDLFGYYAMEYHGLFGKIAAVKKWDDHTASVEDFLIPIIHLPKEAVDPMEVVYCDGTGEGYFEAILLNNLIRGLERFRGNSAYGREIISFQGMDLSKWETIAEVSDWSIRLELGKKSCNMYLFEIDTVSFENLGQPRRVYLRRCSFNDDLDFIRAFERRKKKEYPNQLESRGRYSAHKHCCVFTDTAIMIAHETGSKDDWQESFNEIP